VPFESALDEILYAYVLIGYFTFLAVYAIIPIMILKRGKKRLNTVLSLHFIVMEIAVILNFVYFRSKTLETIVIASTISNILYFISPIFIMLYLLIIYKRGEIKNQIIIGTVAVYSAIICLVFFFINDISYNPPVTVSVYWTPMLAIWIVVLLLCVCIIPSIFLTIKIYKEFETKELKRRWILLMIGEMGIYAHYFWLINHFLHLIEQYVLLDNIVGVASITNIIICSLCLYFSTKRTN